MNILLIHPKVGKTYYPRFPLGLGYIAAVLREARHKVKVIDLNAQDETEEKLKERIKTGEFDIVGLTAMITQFKEIKRISFLLKDISNVKIILGGGLGTVVPEMMLKETGVDIVIVGEGEKTVVEVAQRIENQQSIEDLNGIVYRENGNIIKTPSQKLIEGISSLPFPAWDLFPMEKYFQKAEVAFPRRSISIITSRGCPYRCSFCFHGIFGHRYRSRSPENVVEEIELLVKRYGVRGVKFEDDTFILDRQRICKICDLLIEKNIRLMWTCNGRVNLIDKDLLDKMKSAGCVAILYGIESGNQKILNNIDKGIEVSKAREVIRLTWETGIVPHGFMMLGMCGETRQTIQESINFCKEVRIPAEFTIATPAPGTRLYQEAIDRGKIDSLEKLVKGWDHWFEKVLVNLTDIPDNELIRLKKQAEKEVFGSYLKNRKKHLIGMLLKEIKINGVGALIIRLFRGLRLIFRVSSGRGLSGVRKQKGYVDV